MPINQNQSPPARATQQQRELVRILYLEHGHQKASELSGVRYDLVRQWASRYGWTEPRSLALSQNVTKQIADTIQDELSVSERETRLSLARSAKQMAKDCEELPVRHADKAYTVAKTAAIVHRWDQKDQGTGNVVVNVAILGIQPSEVQATARTLDPGVSE